MIRKKINSNGTIKYYNKKGQLHREDGPAFERANGEKHWYQNGLRHRLDGPAVEYFNGDKYWYQNGKLHRLDGPACEYANGDKEWWIDNEFIDVSSQEEFELYLLLLPFS